MKISVSLSQGEIEVLDSFVEREGLSSRSAGVQRAIELLEGPALAAAYADEFADWDRSDERVLWDRAAADGLTSETW